METSEGKRILVAGAGALGSMFAALLRRAGHEVTLLGRRPHLEAIARDGLRLDGIFGSDHVRGFSIALSAAEARGPFDLLVFTVKSYDLADTAATLAGALSSDGAALSVQNGLGNVEALAEVFGAGRVLGAPILIGAEVPAPGWVRVTVYAKPIQIGAPCGGPPGRDLAARWARLFAGARIPAEPTERLFAFLWEKLLYNAPLNALGALLRVSYGALAKHAETRAVMDAVIDEGFAVAERGRVDLLWQTAAECRRHFYQKLLPPTEHHRSSMLRDLERGRRTEIDAINGYLCARGGELGVPTPANRLLASLVRFAESRAATETGR